MQFRLFLMLVATLFVAVSAIAKTHTITLHTPISIGGTELKPGTYKLELAGDTLTITNGRQTAECTVKVEEAPGKFPKDSVRYTEADGKMKVTEIRVGGTNTRIVFQYTSPNMSAQ